MSLLKQLFIVTILFGVLIFGGTFIISVHAMHTFVINQLESHAQDTSSSLGIAISQHIDNSTDLISLERIVDAVFDRGYYSRITVTNVMGDKIYDNIFRNEIDNVPEWFKKIITIEPPIAEALIKQGWNNVGKIKIISNPGYAYFEMWNLFSHLLFLFSISSVIIGISAFFVLKLLLRPLKLVTEQAHAICEKEFSVQEVLPWTTDFREVVMAMNKMSVKLHEMFTEHVEISELMKERSYKDMLTGLGNRRFFNNHFDNILDNNDGVLGGAMFLIRVADYKNYKGRWGYNAADLMLQHIASELKFYTESHNVPILAHFDAADFAIIMVNVTREEIATIANELLECLSGVSNYGTVHEEIIPHIGITMFNHECFKGDVFTRTDEALRAALKYSEKYWTLNEAPSKVIDYQISDWKAYLSDKLITEDILLHYQPVFIYRYNNASLFHTEVFLRIKAPNNDLLCAGLCFSMIEKYGMQLQFDKLLIEIMVNKILDSMDSDQIYAINISEMSLKDEAFCHWLEVQCNKLGDRAKRLCFEISEYHIDYNIDYLARLIGLLNNKNIMMGIDHFGSHFATYDYLEKLNISYIKIDGMYIRKIHENQDNQLIIRSFVEIAHGLDILSIGTNIETEDERDTLLKLHIDGGQGYFIGQPS